MILFKYLSKVALIINIVFMIHSSFGQSESTVKENSFFEESFIGASGFYSFKVVGGEIHAMQTGFPSNDKTLISLPLPYGIEDIKKIKILSSGANHIILLTSDGIVYTWGNNNNGQLGHSGNSIEPIFLPVKGLPKIKEVSAGRFHCLALDFKGNVFAWGNNNTGQLGDGTNHNSSRPARIKNLKDIVSIAAGMHHNLALDKDSMVWAWGINKNGQIGDGTYENRLSPVRINNLNGIIAIKASVASYALKSDASLWSWGYNGFGQLGIGKDDLNSCTPSLISSLPPIVKVECGIGHCIALDNNGEVWTWGNNSCGQLGDGTLDSRNFPFKIVSDCIAIAAGSYHNLLLSSDHTIYATGTINKQGITEKDNSELGYLFSVEKLIYDKDLVEVIIESE